MRRRYPSRRGSAVRKTCRSFRSSFDGTITMPSSTKRRFAMPAPFQRVQRSKETVKPVIGLPAGGKGFAIRARGTHASRTEH